MVGESPHIDEEESVHTPEEVIPMKDYSRETYERAMKAVYEELKILIRSGPLTNEEWEWIQQSIWASGEIYSISTIRYDLRSLLISNPIKNADSFRVGLTLDAYSTLDRVNRVISTEQALGDLAKWLTFRKALTLWLKISYLKFLILEELTSWITRELEEHQLSELLRSLDDEWYLHAIMGQGIFSGTRELEEKVTRAYERYLRTKYGEESSDAYQARYQRYRERLQTYGYMIDEKNR